MSQYDANIKEILGGHKLELEKLAEKAWHEGYTIGRDDGINSCAGDFDDGYDAGRADAEDDRDARDETFAASLIGDADRVAYLIANEWPGMYRREEFAQMVIDRVKHLLNMRDPSPKLQLPARRYTKTPGDVASYSSYSEGWDDALDAIREVFITAGVEHLLNME